MKVNNLVKCFIKLCVQSDLRLKVTSFNFGKNNIVVLNNIVAINDVMNVHYVHLLYYTYNIFRGT